MAEQRGHSRETVALPCTLTRRNGNPVRATTQDVGAGGMRVITERPLSIDEELEFDLAPDADGHPHGRARVVRQQRMDCYALRFELAVNDILTWVHGAAETG